MTNHELVFVALGTPRPQGSKRYLGVSPNGQPRFVEASDVKPWRQAIAKAVFAEWVRSGDSRQFTDPVVVEATFYLPKPKTVKRIWPSVAPDTDKLCRALGDALSVDSKAIQDDSLIVRWEATKLYAPKPEDAGVHVRVRLAAEEDQKTALLLNVTV